MSSIAVAANLEPISIDEFQTPDEVMISIISFPCPAQIVIIPTIRCDVPIVSDVSVSRINLSASSIRNTTKKNDSFWPTKYFNRWIKTEYYESYSHEP